MRRRGARGPTPEPRARATLIADTNEVGDVRNIRCPRYDLCLDVSIRQKWISWDCIGCGLAGPGVLKFPPQLEPRAPPPLFVVEEEE